MLNFHLPSSIGQKERSITGQILPEPITMSRSKELLSAWARAVKYRESGCIYYYSKPDLLKRLVQFMNDEKLFKQYMGNKRILIIDAESFLYEDQNDWYQMFEQTANKTDAYFMVGIDSIAFTDNKAIVSVLEHVISQHPGKAFLLFFTKDFNQPPHQEVFKEKNFLKQFELYHSLPAEKDSHQFIKYLQKKWDINLDQHMAEHIVKHYGNHFYLIKEAVRYLRDNPDTTDWPLTHTLMQKKTAQIWNSFSHVEQSVYIKISQKRIDFSPDEKKCFEFFIKTGWLMQTKNTVQMANKQLEQYCKVQYQKNTLTIDFQGIITINGVPLMLEFSKQEQAVIKKLLHSKNTLVQRETIALCLWGLDWHDHYSNWAIDRIMHRIRHKLKRLGANTVIKTVHGKGFTITS